MKAPETGVDIIFFDAEDYGTPEFAKDRYNDTSDTWCLGSRFWGKNPPNRATKPNSVFYSTWSVPKCGLL